MCLIVRGDLKTFIHTIHLVRELRNEVTELPVADIVQGVHDERGGKKPPSCLQGARHQQCWGYEDVLDTTMSSEHELTAQNERCA